MDKGRQRETKRDQYLVLRAAGEMLQAVGHVGEGLLEGRHHVGLGHRIGHLYIEPVSHWL